MRFCPVLCAEKNLKIMFGAKLGSFVMKWCATVSIESGGYDKNREIHHKTYHW